MFYSEVKPVFHFHFRETAKRILWKWFSSISKY